MEYLTQAIVLNKSDVREHDRLFSLYTKNLGKVRVLAKGVRRIKSKMAGHLEPFGFLAVKIVNGRGASQISNVETLERYQNIVKNLELIKLAAANLNLVDVLVKEGSCDLGILKLLESILSASDDPNKSLEEKKFLSAIFQWQLVSHLGHRPELYHCVICKNKIDPGIIIFDEARGGLVCSFCQTKIGPNLGKKISVEEVKVLRLILEKDLDFWRQNKINSNLSKKVESVMIRFINYLKADYL
jgi:DNA repair protein RecO (recombination protein O)